MNIKMILTSLVGVTAVSGVLATDYETVTSKKYTDTKFQEKIVAHEKNAADSLLTDSDQRGVVQKRPIFTGGEYNSETQSTYIPTMGAMMASIGAPQATMTWTDEGTVAHPTNNDKDATESYSTSFDEADNAWPEAQEHQLVDGSVLAQGLALKQNKLAAGTEGALAQYNSSGLPVTGPAIYDGSTTYAAGTDAGKVATAGFVETKQDNIDATGSAYNATTHPTYAGGSLVETTGTTGGVTERGIATGRKTNSETGLLENGSWVPTVNMLINEVNAAAPSGTADTLANYDNTGALGSGIATYDGSVAYNASTDAGKIPTAAFVETKQDKKECVQWVVLDANNNPTAYYNNKTDAETNGATCWLWDLPV